MLVQVDEVLVQVDEVLVQVDEVLVQVDKVFVQVDKVLVQVDKVLVQVIIDPIHQTIALILVEILSAILILERICRRGGAGGPEFGHNETMDFPPASPRLRQGRVRQAGTTLTCLTNRVARLPHPYLSFQIENC